MSVSLHHIALPTYVRGLEALSAVLDKAAAHAKAHHVDAKTLLQARLRDDMFPMSRQVQIACDQAKNALARLAGVEAPRFEDTETTIDELKARIAKTVDYLRSLKAADVDAGASREIIFPIGPAKAKMKGMDYLLHFSLPNFYFHATTAYDLLRRDGVELGKRDFLGAIPGFSFV